MESRNLTPGLLLIAVGAIILMANLGFFSLVGFWPLIIILAGIFFLIQWIGDRENHGLLMPATVLTIVGLLFLYCEQYGWWNMSYLWPVFLLAPGFGFILMYLLGEQDRGLLVPGTILLVLGVFFLSINRWAGRWWPAILIVLGAVLLIRPPRKIEPTSTDTDDTQGQTSQ